MAQARLTTHHAHAAAPRESVPRLASVSSNAGGANSLRKVKRLKIVKV
jgi:hypothetical protein